MSVSFEKKYNRVKVLFSNLNNSDTIVVKVDEKELFNASYGDYGINYLNLINFSEPAYIEVLINSEPHYCYYDCDNHIVLSDDEKYLPVAYNPSLTNFKWNYVEQITQTLGRFPIITRKGGQNYRTFTLGGMISYELDNNFEFFEGGQFITKEEIDNFKNKGFSSAVTQQYLERLFRDRVSAWLQNGKEKTFYSDQEGKFQVYLSNFSWTSEKSLGRNLYSFSCTATQIKDEIKTGPSLERLPGLYNDEDTLVYMMGELKNNNILTYTINNNKNELTINNVSTDINGHLYMPEYKTKLSGFSQCTQLKSITAKNVTSISRSAFKDCSALGFINITGSFTTIPDYAFSCCISLKEITIPAQVISIGFYAFAGDSNIVMNLSKVTFEKGSQLTSIGSYAFQYCGSLTSIEIPASVTSIGFYAFYDCTSLTSIEIPASVTSIGDGAFYNCDSLTSVTFAENSQLTSIGYRAFRYCRSLASIEIPASVTSIGREAFSQCFNLKKATFKNPNSWSAGDQQISSSDLSNESTAATYLTNNYVGQVWTRS